MLRITQFRKIVTAFPAGVHFTEAVHKHRVMISFIQHFLWNGVTKNKLTITYKTSYVTGLAALNTVEPCSDSLMLL